MMTANLMRWLFAGAALTVLATGVEAAASPKEVVLQSFNGADGYGLYDGLVADSAGNLFGTTGDGGNPSACGEGYYGCGVVFKLSPPAGGKTSWTETVLDTFDSTDGLRPDAGLIMDRSGNLYGTTSEGGSRGNGVVFKLSPPEKGKTMWTETILYSFSGGMDGAVPLAGLIKDSVGNLYGTTRYGGNNSSDCFANCGVVFKLSPPAKGKTAWTETVLYSFSGGTDGNGPDAGLIEYAGDLYGTTSEGGNLSKCGEGCGVVFKLSSPAKGKTAWTETILHRFTSGADGDNPETGLIADKVGNLYGTTSLGGNLSDCNGGCGVVFKLSPPAKGKTGWTETVLHSFTGGRDGGAPEGVLILDSAGKLYGTAGDGGGSTNCNSFGCGVVFKLSPPTKGETAWAETVLHNFDATDGSGPNGGLVTDSIGNLYGTTGEGGSDLSECEGYGCGVAFEITGSGFKP